MDLPFEDRALVRLHTQKSDGVFCSLRAAVEKSVCQSVSFSVCVRKSMQGDVVHRSHLRFTRVTISISNTSGKGALTFWGN